MSNPYAIRMELIDLKPRKLYSIDELAIPTPFNRERANQIKLEATTVAQSKVKILGMCGWMECLDDVMTHGERAYIIALMQTIESGSCTFVSTFLQLLNGK